MAEKPKTRREKAADTVLDYALNMKPEGFTNAEALDDLDLRDSAEFNVAVRDVRRMCADDTIALVADPQGKGESWVYSLKSVWEDGAEVWIANRQKDLVARLTTAVSVAQSIVNATDGRSADGKQSRIFCRRADNLRFEAQVALDALKEDQKEVENGAV